MAKIGSIESQREAFARGRAPVKVVLHYADGGKVERTFHDPVAAINTLEFWIKQIRENYIK